MNSAEEKLMKDLLSIAEAVRHSFMCIKSVGGMAHADKIATTCEETLASVTSRDNFTVAEVVIVFFLIMLEVTKVAHQTMADAEKDMNDADEAVKRIKAMLDGKN